MSSKEAICRRLMAAFLVAAIVTAAVPVEAGPVKAGDPLPNLKKAGVEGTIPEMAGKLVLVDFWATWCGPCKRSFPVMEKLYADFKNRGFMIVAVSVDDNSDAVAQFLKERRVSFSVVRDASQKLVESAGVETMPTSFLVGANGKILSVHNGFDADKSEAQLRKEIDQQLTLMAGKKAK